MKALLIVPALVVAGLVVPVLRQPQVGPKKPSSAYVRRQAVESARIGRALTALRKGDVAKMAEVRATIASLHKGDFRRPAFAALLDERGETRAAFEVERTYAHFMENSVPDDGEMALYARLATKVGRPDEAAWARARIGPKGHYLVWRRTQERAFASGRASTVPGTYELYVNRAMDDGVRLHPAFRKETEELRQRLLTAP